MDATAPKDDQNTRDLLQRNLSKAEWKVTVAVNGIEALALRRGGIVHCLPVAFS